MHWRTWCAALRDVENAHDRAQEGTHPPQAAMYGIAYAHSKAADPVRSGIEVSKDEDEEEPGSEKMAVRVCARTKAGY